MSNTEPSASALRAATTIDACKRSATIYHFAVLIDREFAGERAKIEAAEVLARSVEAFRKHTAGTQDLSVALDDWQRACKGGDK